MEELQKYSRKKFIKQIGLASGAFALSSIPADLLASAGTTKITILHTNDTHSRIDPFPASDPKFGGMGGVARRMQLIHKIRLEEKNVLLLDSGDIFQGTPYFNFYGGELEIKLMSAMKYDASTMGNHDFDAGLEGFAKQLPHASFPFLCSNYDFKNTILAGKTKNYTIIEKGDVRIGIFGVGIELEGLVDEKCFEKTIYNDPLSIANSIAKKLKEEEKCTLVICLSHLGYRYDGSKKISDAVLAEQSENIDLILGGHTHTFLDKPEELKNLKGKKVLVAQTGFGGIRLGRIDFFIDKKTGKFSHENNTVKIS
ncbi:MAG: bifunctional metallophosphatase/5'-nucleotidase [Bacteroidota bacterium]